MQRQLTKSNIGILTSPLIQFVFLAILCVIGRIDFSKKLCKIYFANCSLYDVAADYVSDTKW